LRHEQRENAKKQGLKEKISPPTDYETSKFSIVKSLGGVAHQALCYQHGLFFTLFHLAQRN
jgi:hypothetical protein